MTEDEAKTKWCPFAREAMDGDGTPNRDYSGKPFTKCVASACMAWREIPIQEHEVANDALAESWVKAGWSKAVRAHDGQTVVWIGGGGYCGLAGSPQ